MLDPGTQVGRYEIQRRLGRGGMGAVYVAHDPLLGRMVAIKVFAGELDLPEARERFSREARAAAALNHPNIVTIHDYGEYASQPYIVMEYVPGETLAHVIRRKAPVELAEKLTWIEELCAGADYAHKMFVIHRDIKPSNLVIDRSGRLKILDFGIARVMGSGSNTTGVVGTPGYMAPEQILEGRVDHRADLFSIGVVAYELLAYSEAFAGGTMASITHRVVTADPEPLAAKVPQAPPELIAMVERLLCKDPSGRFDDAESVRLTVSRVRQRLHSDSSVATAPTIVRAARPTPTSGDTPSWPLVPAQSTPPSSTPTPRSTPGHRKTDREALARRREEQRTAALDRARAALAQNDLEAAYDACQQALTFDEQHPDALALEDAIDAAFAARDTPADANGDAGPADFAPVAPAIDPWPTSAPPDALNRPPTATPRPIDRTVVAPASSGGDGAVGQGTMTPPSSTVRAGHLLSQVRQATTRARQLIGRSATTVLNRVSERAFLPPRLTRRGTLVTAGAVGVIACAVLVVLLISARPAPTGTLILDAVPWATITSIRSRDGERIDVPSLASTPLSLTLPPGEYDVVLTGPPPKAQTQRLHVRIDSGATSTPPAARFYIITPDEYFDAYLSTSSAPQPEAAEPVQPSVGQ